MMVNIPWLNTSYKLNITVKIAALKIIKIEGMHQLGIEEMTVKYLYNDKPGSKPTTKN